MLNRRRRTRIGPSTTEVWVNSGLSLGEIWARYHAGSPSPWPFHWPLSSGCDCWETAPLWGPLGHRSRGPSPSSRLLWTHRWVVLRLYPISQPFAPASDGNYGAYWPTALILKVEPYNRPFSRWLSTGTRRRDGLVTRRQKCDSGSASVQSIITIKPVGHIARIDKKKAQITTWCQLIMTILLLWPPKK